MVNGRGSKGDGRHRQTFVADVADGGIEAASAKGLEAGPHEQSPPSQGSNRFSLLKRGLEPRFEYFPS